MKLVSWNVNGIRAAWNHGLSGFLQKFDADIYAFQETKVNEPFLLAEIDGYEAYWSFCDKRKGYSGTLVLTKTKPIDVTYDFGTFDEFNTEGRIITLEFDNFYFVNCYVPNSQASERRKDYRAEWDSYLMRYLLNLKQHKSVVVCGDFNVPISDKDIYAESDWQEWNAEGFQSEERDNLLTLVNNGFVDTYRYIHPDENGKFTWWSNRLKKRDENKGWRLDYFLVSDDLCPFVAESNMLSDIYGSDHCPVFVDVNLSENEKTERVPVREGKYTYQDLINLQERKIPYSHIKFTDMTKLWNSIDWDEAERNLQNMQMALAKSAYSKSPDLIEKWQKRIVTSINAKLLAVRHVSSNSASAGVDKVKWSTPHERMTAALSLDSKGYQAMPDRMLVIKSKNGKQRHVHIETYYDRAMQVLYAYALDPVAESWGDRKSFSYRKGRSAYDMHEYIVAAFSGEDAPEWLVIADVCKCYENISHSWAMQHIPMAKNVLSEFLNAGYVFAGEVFPMEAGVGIGCSISPIIANMTLDGMQERVFFELYHDGDIDYRNGNLLRYADDIIVAVRDKDTAHNVMKIISDFLRERGLQLSSEKSKIIHISEGFTFMSRTYEKRGDMLIARPSDVAIERFMSSLKDTISNYGGSQKSLIEKINRKIDGWTTYHKITEANEAFRKMDTYVAALLLELCESKHPKWSRERILEKYWYVDYCGRHIYSLPNKREVRVKSMADTLYYPYKPVKTGNNPYIDIEYFESRTNERQIQSVTGIYRSIWDRQGGRCHYCGKSINKDEQKSLIVADERKTSIVRRSAYIHKRCESNSYEYIDTDIMPSSLTELTDLLLRLDNQHKTTGQKFYALSEHFRTCDKNTITLTFKQMEDLMGDKLGNTALRKEFWYRTGFENISQCWLHNGYEIKNLHLDKKRRIVFRRTDDSKNKSSVIMPEVLKYQRIPVEAKYELENYFQYIIRKYGL